MLNSTVHMAHYTCMQSTPEACLLLFFYEILVDSTLATRRIGEQKFSCLQFASSAHNVASEVMESFCIFV